MRFIDLFAGLGGFHKALHDLGHECVYASEIDPVLQQTYKENWGLKPVGDIRKTVKTDIDSIPTHNILCAGFPCQPFSKAGKQLGRTDTERGTLFDEIVKILEYRKPDYFILENVPFIAKHDNEKTWKLMASQLEELGYEVDHNNYSPHQFGVPQHRLRMFIVGSRKGLEHFQFTSIDEQTSLLTDINQFIDDKPKNYKALPDVNQKVLQLWQEFLSAIPKDTKVPGFPIWGMEFGATYPYEWPYPFKMSSEKLGEFKGNFGIPLKGMSKKEQLANLPSYARTKKKFPSWKKRWIGYNRQFYKDNKKYIKNIVDQIAQLPHQSWQKLEWNVGDRERNIKNYILQFRASGVRVKNTDFFPSLVCTNTQVPIIGWKNRYITKEEGLKLQSLDGLRKLPEFDNAAFKALGNAVNAKIVKLIAEQLIQEPFQKELYGKTVRFEIENANEPIAQ